MIPLGFFSVCLRAPQLEETVDFYKKLGFNSVGEDAPGLRISLEHGSQSLTFMSFLQDNLINFRGAHIHRLKECMKHAGIPLTLFEEFKSEERLMLDEEGNPLPNNECGSFSIEDPDGHELFFNTHREEREPYEAALTRAAPMLVEEPYASRNRPDVLYSLVVSDLGACIRFYESIGLLVVQEGEFAWVYPPSNVGDTRFLIQLRLGESKNAVIGLANSESSPETLEALGLEQVRPSGLTWHGQDPDGRKLEVSVKNPADERTL